MSGVYSLAATFDITFILPKRDLKKIDKKSVKLFKLHLLPCVENGATIHNFFSFIIPKRTL